MATYTEGQQHDTVKTETVQSQVQEYGDLTIKSLPIGAFQGNGQAASEFARLFASFSVKHEETCPKKSHSTVSSRDATLHHYMAKYQDTGSHEHALKVQSELSHRMTMDHVFKQFEEKLGLSEEDDDNVAETGCLRAAINNFENKCGRLSDYSLKFVSHFVKACNKSLPYDVLFHAIKSLNC